MKWPLSKGQDESQKVPGENKPQGLDVLFAHLRRLERRVTELESKLSTNRRDLNRIDKMVYREAEANKVIEPHPVAAVKTPGNSVGYVYPQGLFR